MYWVVELWAFLLSISFVHSVRSKSRPSDTRQEIGLLSYWIIAAFGLLGLLDYWAYWLPVEIGLFRLLALNIRLVCRVMIISSFIFLPWVWSWCPGWESVR